MATYRSSSPLDAFRAAAAEQVSQALGVEYETALDGIEAGKQGKAATSDLSVPIPKFRLKGDPKQFAQKVVDAFQPNEYLESVSASGPFVQWNMNTKTLFKTVLNEVNRMTHLDDDGRPSHKNAYGSNDSGNGKRVVLDFSSPNIAKPFHAGHLRSTIIGAFLANLYEAHGWEAVRINYLGDWGKQFGLLAIGYEKYGSDDELRRDAITHLYDVYVKINKDGEADPTVHDRAREFFVRMEKGDEEAVGVWKKFRDLSIAKYEETYARLNIQFDSYSGESQVSAESQEDALNQLTESGIAQESQGALIIDLEQYKLGRTIVRKKDGTYVYITRDIGGAYERWQRYKFDKMIYVVASQQDQNFAQLFKVLDLMGYEWADRLQHINFGMVTGMSTRKGTAVFLDQILNESKDVMHEQMRSNAEKYAQIENPDETSDKLGITAVKIQDMAAKRVNNYDFKWSRMTSFEGDTGPYLQYAHVRLSSVERRNAGTVVLPPPSERHTINTDVLVEPKARDIVILLSLWPETVRAAFKALEPCTIVTYCFRLCHAISSAWEVLLVRGQEPEVAMARLWLYVCAKDVLATAMKLLTLEPLTHM